MKFLSAFIAAFGFVFAALAQISSSPIVIKDSGDPVMFLKFSPNGGELVRAQAFQGFLLLDTTTYRRGRTFFPDTEHTPEMRMVAYSPDGTMIATAMGYNGERVWNAADPGKPIPANGSRGGLDEIYVLDSPLRILEPPSRPKVIWTGFSTDGKLLITTQENDHVKVWNTISWTVKEELIVIDSHLGIAAFAPDSKTLIVGGQHGTLHQWSLETKAEIQTLPIPGGVSNLFGGHVPAPLDVAFSPDGKTLVATYLSKSMREDGAAVIWNTANWTAQTERGYNSAAFSKDGKLLALGGHSHIKLIDLASWKQIHDIELAEMTFGEVMQMIDPQRQLSPNQEAQAKEKAQCGVWALAFSPDGHTLAAGCSEGTVRLIKIIP
jgi:WD40 repeat protein